MASTAPLKYNCYDNVIRIKKDPVNTVLYNKINL